MQVITQKSNVIKPKPNMRFSNAHELVDKITENLDGSSFSIHSQTSDKVYEIQQLGENLYACTCPDFEYREIESCKHIEAVKLYKNGVSGHHALTSALAVVNHPPRGIYNER